MEMIVVPEPARAQPPPPRLPRARYLTFGAPCLGEAEIAEVVDALRGGWIGTGPRVTQLEALVREYTGARHAVALNSCTAALHLSLLAAGVGPGDEVITTPMTFCATANAIVHTGATPVFVDCDRDTQLINPAQVAGAVTPRTRAILPVHFAGRVADLDALHAIARAHGLVVIEDAAHALEARHGARKVGTISPLTCFSFYVNKNMTTGEGGMVTTDDAELAARIRVYGLHGMDRDAWKRYSDEGYRHYEVHVPGFKYNMMDLQAAIGLHQLPRLPAWLERRGEIWQRYDEAFAGLPLGRPRPPDPAHTHARHLYTVMVDPAEAGITRDALMARLHALGIGTGVHYRAVHLHPYYRDRFGYRPEDFPNAAWISERTVSLPLSPALSDDDVEDVIEAVHRALPGRA
jgi:dTDP-4-amino-4,6-dideoxygalactose transaminase